jgi:hypothetical protein
MYCFPVINGTVICNACNVIRHLYMWQGPVNTGSHPTVYICHIPCCQKHSNRLHTQSLSLSSPGFSLLTSPPHIRKQLPALPARLLQEPLQTLACPVLSAHVLATSCAVCLATSADILDILSIAQLEATAGALQT